MSRHHAVHAGDVEHIINHINSITATEAERIYGIEFMLGGAVYDELYNKSFGSVAEWAEYNVQQDEIEYEEDINTYKSDHPQYG